MLNNNNELLIVPCFNAVDKGVVFLQRDIKVPVLQERTMDAADGITDQRSEQSLLMLWEQRNSACVFMYIYRNLWSIHVRVDVHPYTHCIHMLHTQHSMHANISYISWLWLKNHFFFQHSRVLIMITTPSPIHTLTNYYIVMMWLSKWSPPGGILHSYWTSSRRLKLSCVNVLHHM